MKKQFMEELLPIMPQVYGYINHASSDGLTFHFLMGNIEYRFPIPLRNENLVDEIEHSLFFPGQVSRNHPCIVDAIDKRETNLVMLMPINSSEFLYCLKIRHQLEVLSNSSIIVGIFNPSGLGAFWDCVVSEWDLDVPLSLTFGIGDDWVKANMTGELPVYKLQAYFSAEPANRQTWLKSAQSIGKGAFLEALNLAGIKGLPTFLDMWQEPLLLQVRQGGKVINEYNFLDEQVTIPSRHEIGNIRITPGQQLALGLNCYEVCEDILPILGICIYETTTLNVAVEISSSKKITLTMRVGSITRRFDVDSIA